MAGSRPGTLVAAGGGAARGALRSARRSHPMDLWWLALLCPAVLIGLWTRATTPAEGAWLACAFGLGLYSAGTWWLYISIHGFGQAPIWIALLVMAALVAIMAAWQAFAGLCGAALACATLDARLPAAGTAAWVIVEWWRGWFLSGFPWLSLGYSQTDTWLAGLAPVGRRAPGESRTAGRCGRAGPAVARARRREIAGRRWR